MKEEDATDTRDQTEGNGGKSNEDEQREMGLLVPAADAGNRERPDGIEEEDGKGSIQRGEKRLSVPSHRPNWLWGPTEPPIQWLQGGKAAAA
jgi:hypothetical protein